MTWLCSGSPAVELAQTPAQHLQQAGHKRGKMISLK